MGNVDPQQSSSAVLGLSDHVVDAVVIINFQRGWLWNFKLFGGIPVFWRKLSFQNIYAIHKRRTKERLHDFFKSFYVDIIGSGPNAHSIFIEDAAGHLKRLIAVWDEGACVDIDTALSRAQLVTQPNPLAALLPIDWAGIRARQRHSGWGGVLLQIPSLLQFLLLIILIIF